MILQALVEYYENLVQDGVVSEPGWGPAKVSYALCIDEDGNLCQVLPQKILVSKGKKSSPIPQTMIVPAQVKRSSGVSSNFLCDNSSYVFGVDNKGKEKRSEECFCACKKLHNEVLKEIEHPAAKAVINYFEKWSTKDAREHNELQNNQDELFGSATFIFEYEGRRIHEIPEIRNAWLKHYNGSATGNSSICMVTGQEAPIATLHPSIKGIIGAQSSGASLVSFNAQAFCSYGKEQGSNAPTSEYAAFAYGTALNHLISDKAHAKYVGDMLIIFWSANGKTAYQDMFGGFCFEDTYYANEDYAEMLNDIVSGRRFQFKEEKLDPDCEFYVLGISPNAARLSVRFFHRNTFGNIMNNVINHHKRMEIVQPSYLNTSNLSVWQLIQETVNQNSKDKKPSPVLAGELVRSIIEDNRYPMTLLNGITLRIRADHKIDYRRAAIIKAFYLKNTNKDVPKEVLTVSLNENSTNVAYNLGRMFAALEMIQKRANPNLNSTIRDKYFNSASATPAHVFPTLNNLAFTHLKVIKRSDKGSGVYYEKMLQGIAGNLPETFPKRMTLPEQGSFQLGYYHQMQALFTKKEEE